MKFVIRLHCDIERIHFPDVIEWIGSLALAMTFVLLTTAVGHADTTLRFQSVIRDNAKTLGDLVLIENDKDHWSRLPLQSHPDPGDVITKTRILDWMTQRLGPIKISWHGKTNIKVERSIQTTGQALINKAKATLMAQLKPRYTHVKLEAISHIHDSEYAIDDFKTTSTLHYPTAKRVCIWLIHKQQPRTRIAVWFKVGAYANVWVANHDLNKNTFLTNEAFTLQARDIAGLIGEPAQSIPKPVMLTTSMTRNSILMDNAFKAPPLVTQGQLVKVTLHHHRITLVIDAIALGEGTLGQTITVKNPLTQKTFAVRISGFQQAETTP